MHLALVKINVYRLEAWADIQEPALFILEALHELVKVIFVYEPMFPTALRVIHNRASGRALVA